MGQKVNPHGMRVGVIKDWDSRWFTSKQEFGDTLVEDHKIRKTLKKQLYAAGVPKIEIERTVDSQTGTPRVKVNVFCAKPGIVIGKGGAESAKIEKQLAKLTGTKGAAEERKKKAEMTVLDERVQNAVNKLIIRSIQGCIDRADKVYEGVKKVMDFRSKEGFFDRKGART